MIKPNRFLFIASTIGIISIVSLMILYRQLAINAIVDHETRSNVALTRMVSNIVVTKYRDLIGTDTSQIMTRGWSHPSLQALDNELKPLMLGSRLVKVKIYNLDGLTIYSTDPSQLNEEKSDNFGFVSARSGKPTSNITFRDQFDSFEGMLSDINVVSSYIPVFSHPSREPEAVFEVYSDVTELVQDMNTRQWQIIVGVLGSVSILYLLLIMISRRADRVEASRQQEALRNEAQMRYQASHDALTGLINRQEFERRAEKLISETQNSDETHALCFMDLDQFKVVNDTCGHFAGDELLHQLGRLLQDSVRGTDILGRLGGDEFGIVIKSCSEDEALEIVGKLLQAIQKFQFFWEGKIFPVGASIGLVSITASTISLVEVLQQADAACYMAKDSGRNKIHVFRSGDTEISLRHGEMQWVSRINQALEENRYALFAQEIAPLDGTGNLHYELLLRMIDETGSIVPPDTFLRAAERYDIIVKLDTWVIEHSFRTIADNPAFVDQINFLSINLSGQSITDVPFLEMVISRLEDFAIDTGKICFEITETAAISNLRDATRFISALSELGCQFALDDFGSGLSSFGYLKNLPVDYLKVDGMFVKNIIDDPIDYAMVKSINDIGHVMGKKTIAEFVENDAIRKKLVELGVDYAQGYGIGRPQPIEKILLSSMATKHDKAG